MLLLFDALFKTVLTPTVESTLSIKRSELQTQIASFLGVTDYAVPTDSNDLSRVNDAIASGLRNVYWPALVLGEGSAHEWSWMRPTMTFTTAAEFANYQLPSDFGGIEGDITYAANQAHRVIQIVGENFVRQQHQVNTSTGIPMFAAVVALNSGLGGQRYELRLHPTPDTAYELTFRYNINPDALAAANDFALGGPALAETILQSCRASADRIFNDNVGTEQAMFIERLKTSVSLDRRMLAPERLGFTHDPSVLRERFFPFSGANALPGFVFNDIVVQ